MMQDHTNILLSEATNHILNSKNSVEMLYDKPGPPYDSAKVDKNSKPGKYLKKIAILFFIPDTGHHFSSWGHVNKIQNISTECNVFKWGGKSKQNIAPNFPQKLEKIPSR